MWGSKIVYESAVSYTHFFNLNGYATPAHATIGDR